MEAICVIDSCLDMYVNVNVCQGRYPLFIYRIAGRRHDTGQVQGDLMCQEEVHGSIMVGKQTGPIH